MFNVNNDHETAIFHRQFRQQNAKRKKNSYPISFDKTKEKSFVCRFVCHEIHKIRNFLIFYTEQNEKYRFIFNAN
jgi:hypothetical protein